MALSAPSNSTEYSKIENPFTAQAQFSDSVYDFIYDENSDSFYIAGAIGRFNISKQSYQALLDSNNGNIVGLKNVKVNATIRCAIPDGVGGFYIGGFFTAVNDITRNRAAHIQADGTLSDWNPNCNNAVYSILKDGSNIYLGGDFTTVGGVTRNRSARVNNSTGALDSVWNPNCNNSVYSMVIDEYSVYVYLGGNFTLLGSTTRDRVARLDVSRLFKFVES